MQLHLVGKKLIGGDKGLNQKWDFEIADCSGICCKGVPCQLFIVNSMVITSSSEINLMHLVISFKVCAQFYAAPMDWRSRLILDIGLILAATLLKS